MAKPPSDAPVFFDVQGDSSKIKQRKDGSYKLVLKGVEKVHWKTKGDDVEEGYRNAASYVEDFEKYYPSDSEVDAYQTFTLADGIKDKCKFTLSSPKYSKRNDTLVYALTPKNAKHADKITGIQGSTVSSFTVQSTEPVRWTPDWMPDGRSMDLRGADLSYADMSGARLDSARLNKANLSHADLRNARFDITRLSSANLSYANLNGARLFNQRLSSANLSHANLNGTNLTKSILNNANLSYANLRDASLAGAVLDNANLSHADLRDAHLNQARLTKANLSYADLKNASIVYAPLDNANLRFANISNAFMSRNDVRGADFSGAIGYGNRAMHAGSLKFKNTTCPDGSMNIGTSPCQTHTWIPLADPLA